MLPVSFITFPLIAACRPLLPTPLIPLPAPTSHRSQLKHNFCIDVLERGCHQAHTEMYHILRRDAAQKAAAKEPAPLIEETPHKLQKLKQCLVDVEESVRRRAGRGAAGMGR